MGGGVATASHWSPSSDIFCTVQLKTKRHVNLDPVLHAARQSEVICTLKLLMHMFKDRDEKTQQCVMCQTDNEADSTQRHRPKILLHVKTFPKFSFTLPCCHASQTSTLATVLHMQCIVSNSYLNTLLTLYAQLNKPLGHICQWTR